ERWLLHVQRNEAAARSRGELELALLARVGRDRLQLGRRRREVAVRVGLAAEDLLRRDGRVEPLPEDDLVGVRRTPARLGVPVRVADEHDLPARRVPGDLSRGVVLDHVWARRNFVVAVRRALALVELPGVLRRDGRRQ